MIEQSERPRRGRKPKVREDDWRMPDDDAAEVAAIVRETRRDAGRDDRGELDFERD